MWRRNDRLQVRVKPNWSKQREPSAYRTSLTRSFRCNFKDDRFDAGTFWRLSNAFTSAFKKLEDPIKPQPSLAVSCKPTKDTNGFGHIASIPTNRLGFVLHRCEDNEMSEPLFCLRCKDTELMVLEVLPDISFYECPHCYRHYALQPGALNVPLAAPHFFTAL